MEGKLVVRNDAEVCQDRCTIRDTVSDRLPASVKVISPPYPLCVQYPSLRRSSLTVKSTLSFLHTHSTLRYEVPLPRNKYFKGSAPSDYSFTSFRLERSTFSTSSLHSLLRPSPSPSRPHTSRPYRPVRTRPVHARPAHTRLVHPGASRVFLLRTLGLPSSPTPKKKSSFRCISLDPKASRGPDPDLLYDLPLFTLRLPGKPSPNVVTSSWNCGMSDTQPLLWTRSCSHPPLP